MDIPDDIVDNVRLHICPECPDCRTQDEIDVLEAVSAHGWGLDHMPDGAFISVDMSLGTVRKALKALKEAKR